MPPSAPPDRPNRPNRPVHTATVTDKQRISPDLIRLSFDCPALIGMDLPFTDHYVKLMFGEVTRTYTLRSFDTAVGSFDIDFVTHGDTGLAGPWAQHAQSGEEIAFKGPGGAWAPMPHYDNFVLAGDESAAPAVCASVEKLPPDARATVVLEVADSDARFDVPQHPQCDVRWVYRQGQAPGAALAAAIRELEIRAKKTGWFVHGVAEMIRDIRRYLFVEQAVDKADVSISGYWRIGMTEDQWQASKRQFNAENEQQEQKLRD